MKRGLLAGVLVLVLTAAPAAAHVRSTTGYSEITRRDGVVAYRISLESDLLAAAAGHGPPEDYVLPRVQVAVDGVGCEGELERSGRERRDGRDHTVLDLVYDCPGAADGAYTVEYSVFADNGFVDDHANVARYDVGEAQGTFVFDAGHHELDAGDPGAATRFVGLGVEHILSGLDHVLFLVALLLGAQGLRQVVKLATAFTAAHSVTLGLGALGWVQVSPAIVEPLIALSIAYVAAENILGGATRHRLGVVFGFGLLHGLGFASSLTWSGGLDLGALVTFNVGIELGQALIVLALFPALLLIRRYRWSPLAHGAAGACAAAVGLFWFAERLMA
jgi:HupE / UreJ protein